MTTPSSGLRDPSPTSPGYPRLSSPAPEAPEPFDAITELFLGGEETAIDEETAAGPLGRVAVAPAQPVRRVRPEVEGLVLGHLPVFAGAWVGEYARHAAAEAKEPVVLIRLGDGEARLDLYGGSGAVPAPSRTVEEAVRTAAAVSTRWILRVGAGDEPGIAGLSRVDRVTVLSGADDTAIVAAYRTLKELSHAAEPGAREMGVALMGAAPGRAGEIEEKLLAVSRTFLGSPIRVVASVERIAAGAAVNLFRGHTDLTPRALLAMIDETGRAGPAALTEPAPARGPGGTPTADSAAPTAPLASLVTGLRALPARCPFAPGVELASDGAGQIHLLTGVDGGPGEALAMLLSAAAWARENHGLLCLATPGLDPHRPEPVLHLLTSRPAEVRRLLETPVRIHVLRWAEAGGRRVPVCAPLN